MNTPKIAVIGAGIAGLSCATQLKAVGLEVELFEKSRAPSGRMSTRHGDGWTADHGAQYFTARDPRFIQEVNHWLTQQVAAQWHPRIKVYEASEWRDSASPDKRYVGTPGMNSPGQYLASHLNIHFNQTINQIERRDGHWMLHSQESGVLPHTYDYLLIALPAPQAAALTQSQDPEIHRLTSLAGMMGNWTLMVQFKDKQPVDFDAAFINQEIVSWICNNQSKPDRDGLETWTIQASAEWSQQWLELDKDVAAKEILECVSRLGFDCQDAVISSHRWRYASGSVDPSPGYYLSKESRLGLCGDWLNGGRVEGAWLSGYQLASQIKSVLQLAG